MEFYIGQILTGAQPEYREAAVWCNANNAHICVYKPGENGRFKIVENPDVSKMEDIEKSDANSKSESVDDVNVDPLNE